MADKTDETKVAHISERPVSSQELLEFWEDGKTHVHKRGADGVIRMWRIAKGTGGVLYLDFEGLKEPIQPEPTPDETEPDDPLYIKKEGKLEPYRAKSQTETDHTKRAYDFAEQNRGDPEQYTRAAEISATVKEPERPEQPEWPVTAQVLSLKENEDSLRKLRWDGATALMTPRLTLDIAEVKGKMTLRPRKRGDMREMKAIKLSDVWDRLAEINRKLGSHVPDAPTKRPEPIATGGMNALRDEAIQSGNEVKAEHETHKAKPRPTVREMEDRPRKAKYERAEMFQKEHRLRLEAEEQLGQQEMLSNALGNKARELTDRVEELKKELQRTRDKLAKTEGDKRIVMTAREDREEEIDDLEKQLKEKMEQLTEASRLVQHEQADRQHAEEALKVVSQRVDEAEVNTKQAFVARNRMEKERDEARRALAQIQAEQRGTLEIATGRLGEIERLNQELEKTKSKLRSAVHDGFEMRDRISEVKKQRDNMTQRKNSLTERLQKVEEQLGAERAVTNSAPSQWDEGIRTDYYQRLERLQAEREQMVEAADERAESLTDTIEQLKNQRALRKDAEMTAEGRQETIEALQARLLSMEQVLSEERATMQALSKQVKEPETKLKKIMDERDGWEEKARARADRITNLENELEREKDAHEATRGALQSEVVTRLNEMEKRCAAESELAQMEQEPQEENNRLASLLFAEKEKHLATGQTLKQIRERLNAHRRSIENLETELKECRRNKEKLVEGMENELTRTNSRRFELRKERDEASAELEQTKQHLQDANEAARLMRETRDKGEAELARERERRYHPEEEETNGMRKKATELMDDAVAAMENGYKEKAQVTASLSTTCAVLSLEEM